MEETTKVAMDPHMDLSKDELELKAIAQLIAKHQPGGSPPPGGLASTLAWILDTYEKKVGSISPYAQKLDEDTWRDRCVTVEAGWNETKDQLVLADRDIKQLKEQLVQAEVNWNVLQDKRRKAEVLHEESRVAAANEIDALKTQLARRNAAYHEICSKLDVAEDSLAIMTVNDSAYRRTVADLQKQLKEKEGKPSEEQERTIQSLVNQKMELEADLREHVTMIRTRNDKLDELRRLNLRIQHLLEGLCTAHPEGAIAYKIGLLWCEEAAK